MSLGSIILVLKLSNKNQSNDLTKQNDIDFDIFIYENTKQNHPITQSSSF